MAAMAKRMLILLTGRKGSGKSTVADWLKAKLRPDYTVKEQQCARTLKESCSVMYNVPLEYFEDPAIKDTLQLQEWGGLTPRELLLATGDTLRMDLPARNPKLCDVLLRGTVNRVDYYLRTVSGPLCVIVPDVRLPAELNALRNLRNTYPGLVVYQFRVLRPEAEEKHQAGRGATHHTEYALEDMWTAAPFHDIHNSGNKNYMFAQVAHVLGMAAP